MAKNRKTISNPPLASTAKQLRPPLLVVDKLSRCFFVIGFLSAIVGFYLLTCTDPSGKNAASILSPLLIIMGYGLVGVGLYRSEDSANSIDGEPPDFRF